MKNHLLKYLFTVAMCLAAVCFNSTIQAQSIDGSIQFIGGAYLNGSLSSSSAFTSIFGNVLPGSETGDYSSVPDFTGANFSAFTFNPVPVSPFTLWTFMANSTVYSFTVNSLTVDNQTSAFLNISGIGTAHIDGLTDTQGSFTITDTGLGSSQVFTFGAGITVPVVPEPATATCLLLGLGVLACSRRFRN